MKAQYRKGKPRGLLVLYHENGTIHTITYLGNKNKQVGPYEVLDDKGHLIISGAYDDNGKGVGLSKTYHSNGKIATIIEGYGGRKNGFYLEFDTLGKLSKDPVLFINDKIIASKDKLYEDHKELLDQVLSMVQMENERTIFKGRNPSR